MRPLWRLLPPTFAGRSKNWRSSSAGVKLLETAETLMAFPYSRAWLDLQRFVVEACLHSGRNSTPSQKPSGPACARSSGTSRNSAHRHADGRHAGRKQR